MPEGSTIPIYDPTTGNLEFPETWRRSQDIVNRIDKTNRALAVVGGAMIIGEMTHKPHSLAGIVYHNGRLFLAGKDMGYLADFNRSLIADTIMKGLYGGLNQDPSEIEFWENVAQRVQNPNLEQTLKNDAKSPTCTEIGGPQVCTCGITHPPHAQWDMDCDKALACWCSQGKHCGAGIAR